MGRQSRLWSSHRDLALGLAVSIPSGVPQIVSVRERLREFINGAGMLGEAVGVSGISVPEVVHACSGSWTPSPTSVFVGVGLTARDISPWSCPTPEPSFDLKFCHDYIVGRADSRTWLPFFDCDLKPNLVG